MAKQQEINSLLIAKTFKGLEEVLAREAISLGAADVKILNRAISFTGDKSMIYKSNLNLRTALKILKPIATFRAKNEVELYKGIYNIEWGNYIDVDQTLAIFTVVSSPYFNHTQYVALKAKDAVVDQFKNLYGKRPSIDTTNPDFHIHLHLVEDECTVLLDSSGEPLNKRGYRINSTIAPINEVLAAGMVLLSQWEGQSNFIDPMCGSGTIPIEAALIAYNIPPGIFRKQFAFEKWKDFDKELFEEVYNEDLPEKKFNYKIIASDISAGAIRIAIDNAKNAFIQNKIEFITQSFEKLIPPEGGGLIMMNPPYGERLKKNDLESFYERIGNQLKKSYSGYEAWIISSNKEAIKRIGLKPSQRIALLNGALECNFLRYNLYKGSMKKNKFNEQD
jgi:putative N6-adenine-specific DNA methylase